MTDRELLQQAFKYLKVLSRFLGGHRSEKMDQLMMAIEIELSKPEQEPEIVRRVRRYTGKRRESVGSPHITAKECIALANWIDSILAAPQELAKQEFYPDWDMIKPFYERIAELEAQLAQPEQEPLIDGDTSDGYHTFNELYDFRKAYNAALFNEWATSGKYSVHKSKCHYNGETCFGGGWFIVIAQLPNGQISNHYEMKDWQLFQLPETEKALFEYDNHTSADVLKRLYSLHD